MDRMRNLDKLDQMEKMDRVEKDVPVDDLTGYNLSQSLADQITCKALMEQINRDLPDARSKIWHGSPVWFIDGNPIVGYSKIRKGIQLLFWSGQSFDEEDLRPVGKFKAAEACYTGADEINVHQLSLWLTKSVQIQWDYKNVANRQGELLRIHDEPGL